MSKPRDHLPTGSETIELWPLSRGGIDGAADGFIDAVFESGADLRVEPEELYRKDYLARATRGDIQKRSAAPRRRARFFDGYLSDILARDVKQVADIEHASDMRHLISLLAAQVGGLLNASQLANDLRISAPTVRNYLEILKAIYLIRLVPAWSANATTRAIATPKLIFVDSGMAAHLTPGTPDDSTGGLLENFVLSELSRQLTWSRTSARLYHYRDRDNYEVDGVLEDNTGQIVGIEVKAAETVRTDDFRGLRLLKRRVGSRFLAGVVLYCGAQQLSFGEALSCLPLSALWTAREPA